MIQELDYIIIDYMYRDANNTTSRPTKPMISFNPNGYTFADLRAKLKDLGNARAMLHSSLLPNPSSETHEDTDFTVQLYHTPKQLDR